MTHISRTACLIIVAAALALCLAAHTPAAAAQADEVKAMVKSAVKLIEAKGEPAFTELNAPNGPWRKGPTAIFVADEKGVEVVNAAEPEMVGKNLWDYKDANGKLLVQEQWKLVKAKGEGWIDGVWVKPGTDKPTPCRSFVQMAEVDGKLYLVGAAYYR